MLLTISPAKEVRKSPSKLRRKFATNFAENFANFTLEITGAYKCEYPPFRYPLLNVPYSNRKRILSQTSSQRIFGSFFNLAGYLDSATLTTLVARAIRNAIRANRFARIIDIRNRSPYFYSASGRFAQITRNSDSRESPDSRESCESIRANHATKLTTHTPLISG